MLKKAYNKNKILSIDSGKENKMNNFISTKEDVANFLKNLIDYINSKEFNCDEDFFLSYGRGNKNVNTLAYLGLDTSDVINELKNLSLKDYSETVVDNLDANPRDLYVFGKYINNELIYIKIKLRNVCNSKKQIICLSFHKADHGMNFPYKN